MRATSSTLARTFTVADAHALADRLERNQRLQSDQAMAVKLIRALLAGRAAGEYCRASDRRLGTIVRGGARRVILHEM